MILKCLMTYCLAKLKPLMLLKTFFKHYCFLSWQFICVSIFFNPLIMKQRVQQNKTHDVVFLRGFLWESSHKDRRKPLSRSAHHRSEPPSKNIHFHVPPLPGPPRPVISHLTADARSLRSSLRFGSHVRQLWHDEPNRASGEPRSVWIWPI